MGGGWAGGDCGGGDGGGPGGGGEGDMTSTTTPTGPTNSMALLKAGLESRVSILAWSAAGVLAVVVDLSKILMLPESTPALVRSQSLLCVNL